MALPWRVVWVTGASAGIGAEICKQLAAQGVKVAASARNAEALAALGVGITGFPLDVTDEKKVAECFAAIEEKLGDVDLVIAGAGTYTPASAADFRTAMFRQMYEVNYLGVINMLAATLPVFRARKAGHLSWIASVSGYRGLPKAAAYGPTKAALINLAESLQPELAVDGVKVSVINPGFVRTPMTAVNDFEMPFLMEPAEAARATIAGLAKGKFEVAYPAPFVAILKIGRLLPYWLFLWVSRKYLLK
jgi:NAD(P)-dependent dehydrogenase (short-subunit alcohol dehydrogenase family)